MIESFKYQIAREKHYFNDNRPLPTLKRFECCGCRNIIEIHIVSRYPHGPDEIICCPVCRQSAIEDDPGFRPVEE